MQMNEEQFKLFCDFLDALRLVSKRHSDSYDAVYFNKASGKFRNSLGLHQHSDQSGPWKAEE